MRVGQPHVLPRPAGVGRLPDAVAVRHVAADRLLAAADVDHVRIPGANGNRADRAAEEAIGDVPPRAAAVLGLPYTAAGRAHVVGLTVGGNPGDRSAASAAVRADLAPFERGERSRRCVRLRVRSGGDEEQQDTRAQRHRQRPFDSDRVRASYTLVYFGTVVTDHRARRKRGDCTGGRNAQRDEAPTSRDVRHGALRVGGGGRPRSTEVALGGLVHVWSVRRIGSARCELHALFRGCPRRVAPVSGRCGQIRLRGLDLERLAEQQHDVFFLQDEGRIRVADQRTMTFDRENARPGSVSEVECAQALPERRRACMERALADVGCRRERAQCGGDSTRRGRRRCRAACCSPARGSRSVPWRRGVRGRRTTSSPRSRVRVTSRTLRARLRLRRGRAIRSPRRRNASGR